MDALDILLEQAQAERNAALAAFNQSRARCDAARAQATQLDAYRADYHQRWSAQFAQGAGLDIVRCYQSFADRLETAIAQQSQAVALAHAAQARASDALNAAELRVASVRKLIERRAAAQRQALERREQKADDEQAMRVARARRPQQPQDGSTPMNPLAMPTTLAPRAATVQAGTTAPESNGDSAGFAAALDLARDPASAAESGRRETDADARALETGTIDSDEHGTAADSEAPELSALLPGWPPAAWPRHEAPGVAAPLEAATERLAALPGERLVRPRGEALTVPSAAEPIAAPSNTPASPRVTATQAADPSAAPSAAESNSAAIAAPAPNTTSAQALVFSAAPSLALFSGTAGTAAANAAQQPFEAQLAAAIDSAAFAPALARQVTWLAGEGVQQARIHLNPAEMGPLSVKIVLDGSQARIDFSADLAATRHAIEASLPTLAAALNDQGLTLAGGGVFDGQARHGTPRERPATPPTTDAGASQTPDGAAGAPPLRAARGLVDLVA